MKPRLHIALAIVILVNILLGAPPRGANAAQDARSVVLGVFDRHGSPRSHLTDGDTITLGVRLAQAVAEAAVVVFTLDAEPHAIASCTIAAASHSCTTPPLAALGWYWGSAGRPQPYRLLHAHLGGKPLPEPAPIEVAPRPVVLIHGFISTADTWVAYSGKGGYLASVGLAGYAVGDGRSDGVMRTGNLARPTERTNTIAENAAVLRHYIDGVKRTTGAEMVDLVAHSMGGLIARYAIDRLMRERDIAQLITLGSPHGGSACAYLPAALGWHLPAAFELQPAYLRDVFNRQITHRHGVPFHHLAGTSVGESLGAPCTGTPSDLVVERGSVATMGDAVVELPYLHTDLPASSEVFHEFVAPHLRAPADAFVAVPDPVAPAKATEPTQFLRTFSGRVGPGRAEELVIDLDRVAVASFGLFDPTRSLQVTVRGASGREITLDPAVHGYVVVDDPSSLVQVGYGFENPAPGPWRLTLSATKDTPPEGAPYAVAVKVAGGVMLDARLDQPLASLYEPVVITGSLLLAEQPLGNATLSARFYAPDGSTEQLALRGAGASKQVRWAPRQPGIYGVEVRARGVAPDGMTLERTTVLALEVLPAAVVPGWAPAALLALGLALVGLRLRARRRRIRQR